MQLTMKKMGAAAIAAALALCVAPAMAMLTPGTAHAAGKTDINSADIDVVTTKLVKKTGEYKSLTTYKNGKQVKPAVKVTVWQSGSYDAEGNYIPGKSIKLKKGKDYTVSYKNNKNIGTAQVVVKGKGAYKGTAYYNFSIKPKATKVTKVKGEKKALNVSWKKVSAKQVDGYVVSVYTRDKKKHTVTEWDGDKKYTYKKYGYTHVKDVVVKNPSATSVKVKGLKKKTKYYVTVQPYKFVSGTYKERYNQWDEAEEKIIGTRVVDLAYAGASWAQASDYKAGKTK